MAAPDTKVERDARRHHHHPRRRRAEGVRAAAPAGMGTALGRYRQPRLRRHQRQRQDADLHHGRQRRPRDQNTDKTSLYFNAIKASALVNGKSADTAQAVRGGVGYDHNVAPRLFVNVFNDYEYDQFQNLDLRFVVGGGLRFPRGEDGAEPAGPARRRRFQPLEFQHAADAKFRRILLGRRVQLQTERRHVAGAEFPDVQRPDEHRAATA